MINFRQLVLMILISQSVINFASWGQDAVEDIFRRGFELPLRWDNIERRPEWVAGKQPERRGFRGRHEVRLNPGESTCIRIPPYEWLRVVSGDNSISPEDLDVSLSNGSGLLASISGASDTENQSVLFNPQSPIPMLAYISRPDHFDEGIRVSLFTSRHEPLQSVTDYRGLIGFSNERKVRIGTSGKSDSLEYWKWDRGDGVNLQLRGPSRFHIETRFRYPNRETSLSKNYHVSVDDLDFDPGSGKIASVEYVGGPESSRLVSVDGITHVVGNLESGYFELPENREYRIAIKTTAPVFLRLLQLEESDHLIPSLNNPAPTTTEYRFQKSPWGLSPKNIEYTLKHPFEITAEQVQLTAMRLARDNSRLEGGMMASNLLWNAGWHRRDYPEMRNRWRDFSSFTYYRNAIPERKGDKDFNEGFFPSRTLYPIGKNRDWRILGESQLPSAFKRLPFATFSHIQNNQTSVYLLPERKTSTQVRIVAQRDRNQVASFDLRIPGETPRRFRLIPERDAQLQETRPSLGEAGLHFLKGGTLDAPAAFRGKTAETVSTGIFEFSVPPEVRRIELRNATGSEDLPVSLQFRTSSSYTLSEDEYAVMATQADSNEVIRQWCLDYISLEHAPAPTGSRPKTEMNNLWEPLRRFVQSRYRQFYDTVSNNVMPDSAIEDVDYLEAEGEFFLAERLAGSLYFHSRDPMVRNRAFGYLNKLATQKADSDLMIMNICVKLICQPDDETLFRLATLLRESGESELALMLALVIQKDSGNRDLRLGLTFKEKQWAHFETILSEDPTDPTSRIWKGIQLWQKGNQNEALTEWEAAGNAGKTWISHAEQTAVARSKILIGDHSGFHDWAKTEIHPPGLSLWKPVSVTHFASYDSAVSVKIRERGTHVYAFVGTDTEPVELTFPIPGLFQIECRPIHPTDSKTPKEGWIEIEKSNRETQRVPVLLNYPSSGLEMVGREHESPGTAITETIALTGWNNRVKIRPDFGPVLVRVSRRVPEVRTGNLPDLKLKTAAWIFDRDRKPALLPNQEDYGKIATISHDHTVTWHQLRNPFFSTADSDINRVKIALNQCDPVSVQIPNKERIEPVRKMRQWLSEFQSGESGLKVNAIASASALSMRRNLPELKPIHSAILRKCFWEPLLATDQNAGFREIETPGWEPESPTMRSRIHYLPALNYREQLISGTDSSVAVIVRKEPDEITMRLSLDSIPFLAGKPLHASVRLDEYPAQEINLHAEKISETLSFAIPKGRSSIRVEVTDTDPNQYLRVEFDAEKNRESLERSTMRNWFVSYREEPLSIRIDGPAWLRIDRRTEHGVESEYRHVAANLETITLPPGRDGNNEVLYRIHVLRHDKNKLYHPPSYTERTVTDAPSPVTRQPWRRIPTKIKYDDASPLNGQEDGTWTGELSYHKRRINDEDDRRGPESFGEGSLTYRYYNEDSRTYSRTTALGRKREFGDNTVGVKHRIQKNPVNSALTYSLDSSLYEQGGDVALSGTGKISTTGELSPKWEHTTSASITGRALSRNSAGPDPKLVDRDVFTEYKNDHRVGLKVAETVTYTPWQDTRVYAGVGLRTNESIISADSINYTIGADQLIGPVRVGADITGYRFFDDKDRTGADSRHRLNVEATGEFWSKSQQRFEAGLRWSHYFEEDENAISIFGRWHFGEGRMYRDFSPREKIFSKFRERRIPHKRNNSIHPNHHDDEIEQDQ